MEFPNEVEKLRRVLFGKSIAAVNRDNSSLTMSDGSIVEIEGYGDCCAGAWITFDALIDTEHAITDVQVDPDSNFIDEIWTIYASGIPVGSATVSWSEGSGYYGYGFEIRVKRK